MSHERIARIALHSYEKDQFAHLPKKWTMIVGLRLLLSHINLYSMILDKRHIVLSNEESTWGENENESRTERKRRRPPTDFGQLFPRKLPVGRNSSWCPNSCIAIDPRNNQQIKQLLTSSADMRASIVSFPTRAHTHDHHHHKTATLVPRGRSFLLLGQLYFEYQ